MSWRKRGVQATYTLDRVGFRTQQVSNLMIGDPAKPDLTVRRAVIQLRIKWNGSVEIYRIAARGVRLKGKLLPSGKVSWGQIDKLLPAPERQALPAARYQRRPSRRDHRTWLRPMAEWDLRSPAKAICPADLPGKLAASSPGLAFGACRLGQFRGFVDVGVTARRPHVKGPIGAQGLVCPASNLRLAQPRMEIDSSFAEAFDQFDGHGRLTMALFEAGENGLANVVSNLTFRGSPALAPRAHRPCRAEGAACQDPRRPHPLRRPLSAEYETGHARCCRRLWGQQRRPGAVDDGVADRSAGIGSRIAHRADRGGAGQCDPPRRQQFRCRWFSSAGQPTGRWRRADRDSQCPRSDRGARVEVSGGDGVTYYWPTNRIRIDGNIATSGGGLPDTRVSLASRRSGGPMSGQADIGPMAYGGSRLLLGTVRFAARRDGWTEVNTVALLDGPFSGGQRFGPSNSDLWPVRARRSLALWRRRASTRALQPCRLARSGLVRPACRCARPAARSCRSPPAGPLASAR